MEVGEESSPPPLDNPDLLDKRARSGEKFPLRFKLPADAPRRWRMRLCPPRFLRADEEGDGTAAGRDRSRFWLEFLDFGGDVKEVKLPDREAVGDLFE